MSPGHRIHIYGLLYTCHLNLLQLILDDCLLLPDGGLQLLVPLQQRVAQLRRQLQVCNITQYSTVQYSTVME